MRDGFLVRSGRIFDRMEQRFSSDATARYGAVTLVAVFLGTLLLIEARRQGWLPESWNEFVTTSHFHGISVAFTVLLIFEVIELVFSLPRSVTAAAGKQFEIMSLILIRQSFKELGDLSEPITWDAGASAAVMKIFSDATGALLIFGLLGLFYRIQRRRGEGDLSAGETGTFVGVKKLIALMLLGILVAIGLYVVWDSFAGGGGLPACLKTFYSTFFISFYTILIFADVLIVLVSLRYSKAYDTAFRYFGFAVATVMIRLALTAPRFIDAAIGVGTMLFALVLIWIDDRLGGEFPHAEEVHADMD